MFKYFAIVLCLVIGTNATLKHQQAPLGTVPEGLKGLPSFAELQAGKPRVVATPPHVDVEIGEAININLDDLFEISPGDRAKNLTFHAGGLPDGVTIADGIISGASTKAGVYRINANAVTWTEAEGYSTTALSAFNIHVIGDHKMHKHIVCKRANWRVSDIASLADFVLGCEGGELDPTCASLETLEAGQECFPSCSPDSYEASWNGGVTFDGTKFNFGAWDNKFSLYCDSCIDPKDTLTTTAELSHWVQGCGGGALDGTCGDDAAVSDGKVCLASCSTDTWVPSGPMTFRNGHFDLKEFKGELPCL